MGCSSVGRRFHLNLLSKSFKIAPLKGDFMTALYLFSIIVFLLVCLVLCAVILMQESKSTGLGASFGGDPTSSVFGTSTADVLKSFTGWMVAVFLVLSLVMSLWTAALSRHEFSSSSVIEEIQS